VHRPAKVSLAFPTILPRLEHDPESGNRFSEKIMLERNI
jgi:hypothetical protein